jgi:hypothetical protein
VDEIKRTADPGYAGNDMQPAQDGAGRFNDDKLHDVGFPLA